MKKILALLLLGLALTSCDVNDMPMSKDKYKIVCIQNDANVNFGFTAKVDYFGGRKVTFTNENETGSFSVDKSGSYTINIETNVLSSNYDNPVEWELYQNGKKIVENNGFQASFFVNVN